MNPGNNFFFQHSIQKILDMYQTRQISPAEVARMSLHNIEHLDPVYHAWICYDRAHFLHQAGVSNARIQQGQAFRSLEGIPVGVKDIFNTIDFPTQMGSPIWENFTPGNDARSVFHVRRSGGILPGKTVTAEFAVHTLGPTLNPHNTQKTPGTSSSGSAVAIALGMVPVALGTQTAGSIVRPSSFCGIYGCKPSFGLIPRTGMLKTTDTLDTVGYFVLHASDLRRIFDVLRVQGLDYPISHAALSNPERQNKPANRPWRVALVQTQTWDTAADYAKDALLQFANQLAKTPDIQVERVALPTEMLSGHEIHATIYNKTLSYYFQDEYKRAELVSPIMHDLIRQGQQIRLQQYYDALKQQDRMIHAMDQFFQNYDIVLSLSTTTEAPLRHQPENRDPALLWTMTHLAVVSAPTFISPNGLPFGTQIVARKYNDYLLFQFIEYLLQQQILPPGPNPQLG